MPRYGSDAVGFALFIVVLQLFALALVRLTSHRRASAATPRRLTNERARRALTWQVLLATILYLLQSGAGWTPESVGFRHAAPLPVALVLGATAVILLAATYELALRPLGLLASFRKATFR